jgi:hypothetical protein
MKPARLLLGMATRSFSPAGPHLTPAMPHYCL